MRRWSWRQFVDALAAKEPYCPSHAADSGYQHIADVELDQLMNDLADCEEEIIAMGGAVHYAEAVRPLVEAVKNLKIDVLLELVAEAVAVAKLSGEKDFYQALFDHLEDLSALVDSVG